MPTHPHLLTVVADGEHARLVRPGPDNTLRTDAALDSVSAHRRAAELGTDRPGAAFHSGSSVHHALAPRHDPQALEREKFATGLAVEINAATARGEFAELLLVAPPHVLAAIRTHLDAATAARIIGALGKDLVKTPDTELRPHLRTWLAPISRANGRKQ